MQTYANPCEAYLTVDTTGFHGSVEPGQETLWSEVEVLQRENLRLRSVLQSYKARMAVRVQHLQPHTDLDSLIKHKRDWLRKKGGYRPGSQWFTGLSLSLSLSLSLFLSFSLSISLSLSLSLFTCEC